MPADNTTPAFNQTKAIAIASTPLVGLLLFAWLAAILLENVAFCAPAPGTDLCQAHTPLVAVLKPGERSFDELRGRLTWSLSVLFFAFTVTATFLVALWIITRTLRYQLLVRAALALVVAGILAYFWLPSGHAFPFSEDVLGRTVYSVTGAKPFVNSIEALAGLALVLIAFAVSTVLYSGREVFDQHGTTPESEWISRLAAHQQRIRLLLYSAALALVAGTLSATSLYSWALTMVRAGNITDKLPYYGPADDIPQFMGMVNGTFYSLLLATIFVPAFIEVRAWAARVAQEMNPGVPPAERGKWVADQGLTLSLPQELVSLLAVVSPVLAGGVLGPLVSLLAR